MQAVRQRRTSQDNSRGMRPPDGAIDRPNGLRGGLVVAGLAGVAALVLATFSTVIRITVGTTTRLANLDTELSGWDRHGPALLVVAGLALVMLVGAARGARPAMAAVLACGVAAPGVGGGVGPAPPGGNGAGGGALAGCGGGASGGVLAGARRGRAAVFGRRWALAAGAPLRRSRCCGARADCASRGRSRRFPGAPSRRARALTTAHAPNSRRPRRPGAPTETSLPATAFAAPGPASRWT